MITGGGRSYEVDDSNGMEVYIELTALMVETALRDILNPSLDKEERARAQEWLFDISSSANPCAFVNLCVGLGARPDRIRAKARKLIKLADGMEQGVGYKSIYQQARRMIRGEGG